MIRKALAVTAAAASIVAGLAATAAPAYAMGYDPDARIRVGAEVDGSGRTEVRVVLDNTASTQRATGEVVVRNTRTGRWTSKYVTIPRHDSTTRYYYLTEGQRFRFSVSYMDAIAAAKTVTGQAPTRPWVREGRSECYGVGTLTTLVYGNPTDRDRTFVTNVELGDGSGRITHRVTAPANGRAVWQVQIGNAPADTWTDLANGTPVASFFVGPVC